MTHHHINIYAEIEALKADVKDLREKCTRICSAEFGSPPDRRVEELKMLIERLNEARQFDNGIANSRISEYETALRKFKWLINAISSHPEAQLSTNRWLQDLLAQPIL